MEEEAYEEVEEEAPKDETEIQVVSFIYLAQTTRRRFFLAFSVVSSSETFKVWFLMLLYVKFC